MPVDTPAAPAAAPSAAPSTPAPAAAPSPAPAAGTPPPSTPAPTVETATSIGEAWKLAVDSVPLEDSAAPEVTDDDLPAPEATDQPDADPAAPEAADDQPAPEGDQPAPNPDDDLTISLSLDNTEFGPKELQDLVTKSPALKQAFEENPQVRDRVFAMARRDQETRGIREIAPTLAIAQEMQRGHDLYTAVDGAFLSATTPEGFKGFMDTWLQQAMIVDGQGKPVMENGKYTFHPALESILKGIHANQNNYLASEMATSGKIPPALADVALKVIDFLGKQSNDERLGEAIGILREVMQPSSPANDEIPESLRPYSESLKAKEKELNDREAQAARTRQESEQVARTEALVRADTKAANVCVAQVKPLLEQAGLSKFEIQAALTEIGNQLDAKLRANPTYQRIRDRLEAGPVDAAREKEITKVALTYSQEVLGEIATKVIHQATDGKLSRQTATDQRVEGQRQASRTEPRGTSVSSSPAGPKTTEQIESDLVKEYRATHGGEDPDRRWLTQQMWGRMQQSRRRPA